MKTQHAPEPWRNEYGTITAAQVGLLKPIVANVTHRRDREANAQRIVECVNALAGVADPASAITAAREALERSRNWLASYPGGGALPALDQVCAALALLKGVGA
jgi:hypothetical protein